MKWIFDKLKQAREALSLNQTQAAAESGVAQKDISLLENGRKEFIPNAYIQFLYSKGIDLNSLFDEEQEKIVIRPSKEDMKIAPKIAPIIAPIQENSPFSLSAQDQLQEYDSRLKSLENSIKDILKRLPK